MLQQYLPRTPTARPNGASVLALLGLSWPIIHYTYASPLVQLRLQGANEINGGTQDFSINCDHVVGLPSTPKAALLSSKHHPSRVLSQKRVCSTGCDRVRSRTRFRRQAHNWTSDQVTYPRSRFAERSLSCPTGSKQRCCFSPWSGNQSYRSRDTTSA